MSCIKTTSLLWLLKEKLGNIQVWTIISYDSVINTTKEYQRNKTETMSAAVECILEIEYLKMQRFSSFIRNNVIILENRMKLYHKIGVKT